MHKPILFFLCASIVAAGCRCKRDAETLHRPQDDANVTVKDVAPPKEKLAGPRFVLVRNDLVDLQEHSAMPWRGPLPAPKWVADETNVFVGDGASLVASAPPKEGYTWSYTAPPTYGAMRALVVFGDWIVGVWESEVSAFDRATGKRTVLLPGAGPSFVEAATAGNALFVMDERGIVTIFDRTGAIVATSSAPTSSASALTLRAFDEIGLICRVTRAYAGSVDCFDAHGPAKLSGFAVATSCAFLRASSKHHLVYSGLSVPCGTWTIRVDDADTSKWADDVAALLERADGSIEGALAFTKTSDDPLRLLDASGATKWSTTIGGFGESLAVATKDERLFLARHDAIATGSSLVALDRSTGKIVWTAAVEQLHIPHSKYSNEVELFLRGDEVVMVGNEAGGAYVQTFDAATGERRFSHVVK